MAAILPYKYTHCMCRSALRKIFRAAPRLAAFPSEIESPGKQLLIVRKSSGAANRIQAWQIQQYGDIGELSLNKAAHATTIQNPNELLIKVHAASVNPIDVRMLGGYGRALINILRKRRGVTPGSEFPLTLGRDFSGTVVETGRAVTKFRAGDEVWGALSADRPGTHAQYTVAAESEISKKPENVTHVEAASMPYVVTTTWAALCTVGELNERKAVSKRLLILGGSGGIGTFAIQLAKAWRMHVTVTCSADAAEMVTSLGADVALDYKSKTVWDELQRLQRFDYILDNIGKDNTYKARPLLKSWEGAHLVTLVSPVLGNSDRYGVLPGLFRTAVTAGFETLKGFQTGRSVRWAVFIPNGAALDTVRQMVEFEKIKPVVQQVFPFPDVPAAFKKVADGHLRGKIVIDSLAQV